MNIKSEEKKLIYFLLVMIPATIGAVCMPLAILGFPHNIIYPVLLIGGIFGLVIWAWSSNKC